MIVSTNSDFADKSNNFPAPRANDNASLYSPRWKYTFQSTQYNTNMIPLTKAMRPTVVAETFGLHTASHYPISTNYKKKMSVVHDWAMLCDFHPELIDQVIQIDECLGLEFCLGLSEERDVSCHRHKRNHRCCGSDWVGDNERKGKGRTILRECGNHRREARKKKPRVKCWHEKKCCNRDQNGFKGFPAR